LQASLVGEQSEDESVRARQLALQQQLHLLYNQLLSEPGRRRANDPAILSEIRTCEAALRQLAWHHPLPLPEATPVNLPALQQSLAADQQALVYFMTADEVMVFVVSRESMQIMRRLCTPAQLADAAANWQFQIGRVELSPEYRARHATRMSQALRMALADLYQLILAALAPCLTAPRLLFIPCGLLHQLPFHALWAGDHFVLEAFECAYAPSASMAVWMLADAAKENVFHSWAGLALSDPAIPGARAEVTAAARHFAAHWLYLDEAASLANLQLAARSAEILHLATHGLFRPDNPFFSMLKLADGWIDVQALYQLPLVAKLVVLSACESGAGVVRGGDDVIGLARGFLAAGARSLLVSLWNVQDASAVALMEDFYTELTQKARPRGTRPAAALRRAQQAAIRAGKHPYEWAPFSLIGC
jgi:CHAT domain-containing protein